MRQLLKLLLLMPVYALLSTCNNGQEEVMIESKVFTDSIYSESLSEYRKHNIYLPKGFKQGANYPIVFSTDGNSEITDKKEVLDSLIDKKVIRPVIFVAAHANTEVADSTTMKMPDGGKVYIKYRNIEYTDMSGMLKDSSLISRFQDHMSYFKDELIPQIEHTLNQDIEKEDRYFYGVSNGAGFGLSLLNTFPDVIGTYICLSTFGGKIQEYNWEKSVAYPRIYLRFGSEESSFLVKDADFLKAKYEELNLFAEIQEFAGGHDNQFWEDEFVEILSRILKR